MSDEKATLKNIQNQGIVRLDVEEVFHNEGRTVSLTLYAGGLRYPNRVPVVSAVIPLRGEGAVCRLNGSVYGDLSDAVRNIPAENVLALLAEANPAN